MLVQLAKYINNIDALLDRNWTRQSVVEGALRFERLWHQCKDGTRLHLHKFDAISTSSPLFWHPHPYPIGVMILNGPYELHLAPERGLHDINWTHEYPPPETSCIILGDHMDRYPSTAYYEMTDRILWHAIRPRGAEIYSIMLGGPIWGSGWTSSQEPFEAPRFDHLDLLDRLRKLFL